jgi:hypothetical protein
MPPVKVAIAAGDEVHGHGVQLRAGDVPGAVLEPVHHVGATADPDHQHLRMLPQDVRRRQHVVAEHVEARHLRRALVHDRARTAVVEDMRAASRPGSAG